jgi:hypothetical protein
METMDSNHPGWGEFRRLLANNIGLRNKCLGEREKPECRKILEKHFSEIDIAETLTYFELAGGYCDCKVLHNVRC